MSGINYVTREDGYDSLIMPEIDGDFLDIDEILEDYPYFLDSMENEDYYIENGLCSFLDEIIFDNKVVGFAAFQIINRSTLLLIECYIMPEFRCNGLFYNEICKLSSLAPIFGILQPPRNVVELLIDYDFAKKVNDDIVVSGIEFYFDEFEVESSNGRKIGEDDLEPTNFYDLSINSSILVRDDEVIYHDILVNDLSNYGVRKKLTDDYFNNIKNLFSQDLSEFIDLIVELKENIPQELLGYDDIVGQGEGLSEYMQELVNNEIISHENAMEIKQLLIKEYESGEINDETIEERFLSLIAESMPDELKLDLFDEFLDSDPENEEMQSFKEFLDLIGQNEELNANVFNALLSGDDEKVMDLVGNALIEDEKFSEDFLNLVDKWSDEDDYADIPDEDFDFLNSLDLNLDSPYPVAEMMWGPNDDKYKLDDTFYGKDYPICHDIYFFRVLNTVKTTNNLQFALATSDIKGAATSQLIESFLFDNAFITDEVNYDNWDEFAHDELTIPDLKDILRQNNLKVSGNKQVLIDRIAENQVPLDEFKSQKVVVTSEGDEFLRNNAWIKFYDDFLNKFDFNDYLKYLDNNEGEFIETTLKYLDEHLKLAKQEENQQYMMDCSMAKEIISVIGKEYLEKIMGGEKFVLE